MHTEQVHPEDLAIGCIPAATKLNPADIELPAVEIEGTT
jgi:hypothetical protein